MKEEEWSGLCRLKKTHPVESDQEVVHVSEMSVRIQSP